LEQNRLPSPGVSIYMEHFIEQILALVAGLASNLVEALPVGYAFGSGMLATVNPCGFALLPAYISLYLGDTGASTIAAAAWHPGF